MLHACCSDLLDTAIWANLFIEKFGLVCYYNEACSRKNQKSQEWKVVERKLAEDKKKQHKLNWGKVEKAILQAVKTQ